MVAWVELVLPFDIPLVLWLDVRAYPKDSCRSMILQYSEHQKAPYLTVFTRHSKKKLRRFLFAFIQRATTFKWVLAEDRKPRLWKFNRPHYQRLPRYKMGTLRLLDHREKIDTLRRLSAFIFPTGSAALRKSFYALRWAAREPAAQGRCASFHYPALTPSARLARLGPRWANLNTVHLSKKEPWELRAVRGVWA
jgi:hypothetical protein